MVVPPYQHGWVISGRKRGVLLLGLWWIQIEGDLAGNVADMSRHVGTT